MNIIVLTVMDKWTI